MRVLLIFIISILFLEARENPFEQIVQPKDSGDVTNVVPKESLKREEIKLPTSSRVLVNVTLEYQNIDGSVEKETLKVDKAIDWHKSIVITQVADVPTTTDANITNLAENFAPFKFISFSISKDSIDIVTKDKKIRDFGIAEPTKIVIDFKRDESFKSEQKNLKDSYFKNISVGKHDGFYRVVILLDGIYKYSLKESQNGYKLQLQ